VTEDSTTAAGGPDQAAAEAPIAVSLTDHPAHAAGLHTVELDGETVVYDETREALHLLDTTATVVWSLLDGSATLAEICADLAAAYDTDLTRVQSDVLAMVGKLADSGLVLV
jgi:coenzyme PQQ synthesis protein D (PqqD)